MTHATPSTAFSVSPVDSLHSISQITSENASRNLHLCEGSVELRTSTFQTVVNIILAQSAQVGYDVPRVNCRRTMPRKTYISDSWRTTYQKNEGASHLCHA